MYLKPLHKYDRFLYNGKEIVINNVPTLDWLMVGYVYEDPEREDNSILDFAWWPKFILKAKKI